MRVSDLADALFRDYTINRRKSLRTVKGRWETHLKPFFEQIPAEWLTINHVEAYIALRLEQKAENSTINRELAALRRMYTLGIRSKKLSLAECPYIPHLKETNVRKGFLRHTQYDALARETAKIGLWLRAMLEVAASYGCRTAELMNLKVRQLNFEERAITLDGNETKNGEGRFLPMTPKVLELLTQCVLGKTGEDYVFTRQWTSRGRRTKNGGKIANMREAWAQATKAAGCQGLLMHDLRRTAVRNLVRSGVSEKIAMQISGHKTRSVFDRYDITDRADLDDAMEKLELARKRREQLDLFGAERPTDLFSTGTAKPELKSIASLVDPEF